MEQTDNNIAAPLHEEIDQSDYYYSNMKLDLIEMGFKRETINNIMMFFEPRTIEKVIELMTKHKGVWQHNFIEDEGNRCLICEEEADHLDKKIKNKYKTKFVYFNESLKDSFLSNKSLNDSISKQDIQLYKTQLANDCNVCFNEINHKERKTVSIQCNHLFCKSCWLDHLTENIINGNVIICLTFIYRLILNVWIIIVLISFQNNS